jgi:hypothetical protein
MEQNGTIKGLEHAVGFTVSAEITGLRRANDRFDTNIVCFGASYY